ncbi:MAG: hypothetical protein F6K25_10720 [Okeania sp. SIO2G4]|uniref:MAE_28990/MAE_18760 family HEPN-like nuclease n=1 Tax=unclassified Okeania TaxID=2634635 RepID=UPI0013BB9A53|nr:MULTISPECIES: MAE_28990/MAE_18760 family HEPN-like nuclease [unclassified Okeania]NEP38153.1 hypothetical protein [Okeania sp. SIO2H7]NEP72003.1 hypothetical protein [Okeania sp. SIO2G5]NEP93539.1 hypothetical protein [Okeania sp. SIO2F5]NEQ91156.1 hypothetical protein [Okeania sp. SIO2G4]
MTSILFQDFKERSKEVSKYFIFLKNLEQGTIQLAMEGKAKAKIKEIDSELIKTLKASAFLLLYNLIESTMRDAIEAIFDELQSQGISFNKIRPELKKIVLENLKNKSSSEVYHIIVDISLDIIKVGFDRKKLFSGNIDAKQIKKTADKYGFSADTKTDSSDLLTVKTNRNDLAHGIKSFAEVGKEKSADELIKIKNNVVKYLRQILENIETYLTNQEYLDSSTNTP